MSYFIPVKVDSDTIAHFDPNSVRLTAANHPNYRLAFDSDLGVYEFSLTSVVKLTNDLTIIDISARQMGQTDHILYKIYRECPKLGAVIVLDATSVSYVRPKDSYTITDYRIGRDENGVERLRWIALHRNSEAEEVAGIQMDLNVKLFPGDAALIAGMLTNRDNVLIEDNTITIGRIVIQR